MQHLERMRAGVASTSDSAQSAEFNAAAVGFAGGRELLPRFRGPLAERWSGSLRCLIALFAELAPANILLCLCRTGFFAIVEPEVDSRLGQPVGF